MINGPVHETLELHELLLFKTVCATKSTAMAGLVKDDGLKSLLEQDVEASKRAIRELQGLLQNSI